MEFGFEELNNLTYSSDYYVPCSLNGIVTSLHKDRFTMYISGLTAISAFPNAYEFNSWRNKPVVIKDGRELKLPQISLEFYDCDLKFKDLSEYNLSTARFKKVDLRGALLKNCNLSGAILEEVNLSQADLSGAVLSPYNQFVNCSLLETNLKDTAMSVLVREAYTTTSKYTRNHFKISKCRFFSGLELTLPRYPQKRMDLQERVDKIVAFIKPADQTQIFQVVAQALSYEGAFNIPDPFTEFLLELQKAYPTWEGLKTVEELLAKISAVLVLEKLSF